MDYKCILDDAINKSHYFNNIDLRFNKKYNILLNSKQLDEYLAYKENYTCDNKIELPLYSFNSKKIYFYKSYELENLKNDYFKYILDNSSILENNYKEIILSRLSSELDGTLRIEGVNTTRKKIENIIKKNNISDTNEQIIYNMYQGYNFIKEKPSFNKDNILKLYKILSYKSLAEEDLPKEYYRNQMVEVGGHDGCDVDSIERAMDSLILYVNSNTITNSFYLPFIVHYYILYIHPYFDYNGRFARMASLWVSMLMNKENIFPTYISEAIFAEKYNYYKAIDNTRNSNNDLTYFLTFLTSISCKYYMVYKNLDEIKKELERNGEELTVNELYYLKRILINNNLGWFNYKSFLEFSSADITKQAAFKILNNFMKLNLLLTKTNSKNEKIFKLNQDIITYQIN